MLLFFFFWISVSIIDQDRYLEITVSRLDNVNYRICFQDKKSILPFLLVLKTVLKIKKTFIKCMILILKNIFVENMPTLVAWQKG